MKNTGEYWDPVGEKIQNDTFLSQTKPLLQKAESFQQNPYRVRRNRNLIIIATIFVIVFLIWLSNGSGILEIIIFSFIPFFIYVGMINNFQQNFILYLMCFENNWIYSPEKDVARFEKLKSNYPIIFNKGHSHIVEDQIWGMVINEKVDKFWTCSFTYTTGSGKHRQTHQHSVFMLRMYKKVPLDFYINKKSVISILQNNYKTESEEFNELFEIKIENENPNIELLLLKVLSPSIQVRLIELASKLPLNKICFYDDIMILDFNHHIWNPKYTNFFNKAIVDDRDKTFFLSQIKTMTAIPFEMLKFID